MHTAARPSRPRPSSLAYVQRRALENLQFAHDTLWFLLQNVALGDFRASHTTSHQSPEWVVTHFTAHDHYCATNLGGRAAPLHDTSRGGYPAMFDDTATVRSKAVTSLPKSAMIRHHRAALKKLKSAASALVPAALIQTPVGSMKDHAPDMLACIERAVWHGRWHSAHVAAIRTRHGLPPKF